MKGGLKFKNFDTEDILRKKKWNKPVRSKTKRKVE